MKTAASLFFNHANNTASHWGPSKLNFFSWENTTVSYFSFVHVTFFCTQSTRILCLAVKAGTGFLFQYKRFGGSWRRWQILLGVMGKFWDFRWTLELDCPLEASQKKSMSGCICNFRWTTWTFSGTIWFRILYIISHNCSGPWQFSRNETYRFSFQFIDRNLPFSLRGEFLGILQ